ncbi:Mitochondrial transcription termination factor family protein [Euphorbia peplus]|nr:Mitochondrial transcription termination factor family protein [Euphorbia peplus]
MLTFISRFRSLKVCHHHHHHHHHRHHKFPIFPPLSLTSFSTTSTHNISPESASKVSSISSPNYLRNPQNADSVLNFLKDNGFAKAHLETLLQKAPWILSANLDTSVKPKIELLQDLGFPSTALAHIVSASPSLLRPTADRLRRPLLGFKNFLGPDADIFSFIKKSSKARILVLGDFDRTVVPNVEYLKSCGICSTQIARFIHLSLVTFVSKPENFKDIVKRVDEMGVDRKSKMFPYAFRVMGSMTRKNWELKLKLFREIGFSDQNISNAFTRAPEALDVSERKIKEVTELLLSVEEFVGPIKNRIT